MKQFFLWLKFFDRQSETSIKRFSKLFVPTKWILPCESARTNVPENVNGSCVHFYLQPLVPLERYGSGSVIEKSVN